MVFINSWIAFSQSLHLKIIGSTEIETQYIDSIGYKKTHPNIKSVTEENNIVFQTILKKGYIECQQTDLSKTNDSSYVYQYTLNSKIKTIHIYIGKENESFINSSNTIKNDSTTIPFENCEEFLNEIMKKRESAGFSLAKTKLNNIEKKGDHLVAQLNTSNESKRQLNNIAIIGYDKFPIGHKKNLLRNYRDKTFNQKTLEKIYTDIDKYRFVKQTKYPEILFKKDSTIIYVYLEKNKANSFDGYLGFTNDENKKMILSGYLDLTLNNILNSGEKFALYWKSDGQQQKTFNLGLDLPYLFNSPLGLKTELNIFKQDSTFQNTRTSIELGYFFNYNTRTYIGYQSTESSDIQNSNTESLKDYTNHFTTVSLDYIDYKNDDFLFPDKTNINLKIGTGKRNANALQNNQFFSSLNFKHNFYLNPKNCISIKSQNYYLISAQYIINELKQFGGINSIRGFNENSLQGNRFNALLTEYRYILAPNLYIHSIIDYANIQDKTANSNDNLLGIGIGLGLLSKNGMFNLVYANGQSNNQNLRLSNSIVHISFKAIF